MNLQEKIISLSEYKLGFNIYSGHTIINVTYPKEWSVIKPENQEITLVKYGAYYRLHLDLDLDYHLSLRQITNLERKIKKDIVRHRSLKIKYVTIYVTNKINLNE